MKGIVFSEFFEMVEEKFGYEVVDSIIEKSDLPSGGSYTAIGTYHHSEIVALLMNLSDEVKVDPQTLLKAFGEYLFDTFLKSYPQFFEAQSSAFGFLESIDNHIHIEVRKLYPEATLPRFETKIEGDKLTMVYTSERKMSALAEGLIHKTMHHYNTPFELKKELLNQEGSTVKFQITTL